MVRNDEKYQPAIDYYFNEAKGDISTKKLAEMFNDFKKLINK